MSQTNLFDWGIIKGKRLGSPKGYPQHNHPEKNAKEQQSIANLRGFVDFGKFRGSNLGGLEFD